MEEKDEKEFNREHVVAQSFGTYEGRAAVLGHCEVCEECNLFFSKALENVINLDSIETVERMRFGKPMSDNRKQLMRRTKMQIASGILEGLDVIPTVNNKAEERMIFSYSNVIGLRKNTEEIKYDFYSLDNLPEATEEKQEYLARQQFGIISIGYEPKTVKAALITKGWLIEAKSYDETELYEMIANEKKIIVTTTDLNDSIKRRFAAKNVFNFLCFEKGEEFVLSKRFDPIRRYIRYGDWDNTLFFSLAFKPDKTMNLPNEHAHALAFLWCPDDGPYWSLYGSVTWYGKMTYYMKLCDTSFLVSQLTKNVLPSTRVLYCNNDNRRQTIDRKGIYGFRKGGGTINLLFPYEIVFGQDIIR